MCKYYVLATKENLNNPTFDQCISKYNLKDFIIGAKWILNTCFELDVVVQARNSELEAEGSGIQDQPQRHSEFKASVGYVRFSVKITRAK